MARIKSLSDLKKERGRPKVSDNERKNNVISFRLDDVKHDQLRELVSPETPNQGARKLVEWSLELKQKNKA